MIGRYEWIIKHFGAEWAGAITMTTDKTPVRGDILIDDKPLISGAQLPTWRQLLFDAPYNGHVTDKPRLTAWADWEAKVMALLSGSAESALARQKTAALMASAPPAAAPPTPTPPSLKVTASAVARLPDFSHLLPPTYRSNYAAWRGGSASGAKGEIWNAVDEWQAMQDSLLNNTSEDFTEVSVFRSGYASWRKGAASGAKGSLRHEFVL